MVTIIVAPTQSFHGLYTAELIHHRGPWRGLDDVEHATLQYVDWFNHRRLHGELGWGHQAEFEAVYSERTAALPLAASH